MDDEGRRSGPGLDVEIQRRLFGTTRLYNRGGKLRDAESDADFHAYYIPSGKPWRTHHIDAVFVPRYSVDIAAAWAVVGLITDPRSTLVHPETGFPAGTAFARRFRNAELWSMSSAEAARSICEMALRAIGAWRSEDS